MNPTCFWDDNPAVEEYWFEPQRVWRPLCASHAGVASTNLPEHYLRALPDINPFPPMDPYPDGYTIPDPGPCSGLCLTGHDIGVPSSSIAYPHPDCPAHGWGLIEEDGETCGSASPHTGRRCTLESGHPHNHEWTDGVVWSTWS